MAFNNSPIDPVPEVIGWPWHGLITKTPAAGSLALPSARTIACEYCGNWTYLWDIGRPAPVVASADPDEQWLSKAIIRGDGNINNTYIYGGKHFNAGPIKLGADVGRSALGYVFSAGTLNFAMELIRDDGTGPVLTERRISISAAACGIDWPQDGEEFYIDVQAVDKTPDGCGWLLRLSRFYAAHPVDLETLAILELKVTGDFIDPVLALSVVAAGTVARGVVTVEQEPPAGGLIMIGRAEVKVGEHTTISRVDAVVWAWYLPGGAIDLVRLRVRVVAIEVGALSGTPGDTAASWSQTVTTTRTLSTANAAAETVQVVTQNLGHTFSSNPSIGHASAAASLTIDGLGLLTHSSSRSIGVEADLSWTETFGAIRLDIKPANQSFLFPYVAQGMIDDVLFEYVKLIGWQSLTSFDPLSNKVLVLRADYRDYGQFESPRKVIYGAALTPSGPDVGQYQYHTDNPPPPGFKSAAHNPITGVSVRHLNTDLFTFV